MKTLPYRATTASGTTIDAAFPLHADTGSAVRIEQMLSALLAALDRDMAAMPETVNGDVLQALAMATAIRARMIHAPAPVTADLARRILDEALAAVDRADVAGPATGQA